MTTTDTLTVGGTYAVTYYMSAHTGRTTTRTLTLTDVLIAGLDGRRTFIFHGARGGKVLLGPAEIRRVEAV